MLAPLIDRPRLLEQLPRPLKVAKRITGRRDIDIRRPGDDRVFKPHLRQKSKRLPRTLHSLVFLARLAVVADHLISEHELPVPVPPQLRLRQPVEQMPLRARVIPPTHILVHLFDHTPLRDRPDRLGNLISKHHIPLSES